MYSDNKNHKGKQLYHTRLRNNDNGIQLRATLNKWATATNDFPYENQPHQNIIDPELDDGTDRMTLEKEYSNTKSQSEIAWPLENDVDSYTWEKCSGDCRTYSHSDKYTTPNRVPGCGYRMCPSVVEIRVNPRAIRKTKNKTQTKTSKTSKTSDTQNDVVLSYDFWDASSYDVKFISKIFGLPTYINDCNTYNKKTKHTQKNNKTAHDLNAKIYEHLQQLIAEMYPYISKVLNLEKFELEETFNEDK